MVLVGSRWRSPEGPTLLGLSRALTSPPNACGQSNHAGTVTATAPGLEQHLAPPVRSSRNTRQEGAVTTPILAGGDGAREQPGPEPQAQALPPQPWEPMAISRPAPSAVQTSCVWPSPALPTIFLSPLPGWLEAHVLRPDPAPSLPTLSPAGASKHTGHHPLGPAEGKG